MKTNLIFCLSSDRLRTMNNMLGHCYAAVILEKISQKDLMDTEEVPEDKEEGVAMIENIV